MQYCSKPACYSLHAVATCERLRGCGVRRTVDMIAMLRGKRCHLAIASKLNRCETWDTRERRVTYCSSVWSPKPAVVIVFCFIQGGVCHRWRSPVSTHLLFSNHVESSAHIPFAGLGFVRRRAQTFAPLEGNDRNSGWQGGACSFRRTAPILWAFCVRTRGFAPHPQPFPPTPPLTHFAASRLAEARGVQGVLA